MRNIHFFLLFIVLESCGHKYSKDQIEVRFKDNCVVVDYKDSMDYIKIPIQTDLPIKEKVPAYCIDTLNNSIYLYIPYFGIKNYSLSNKSLIHEKHLEYRYHTRNHSFRINQINDFIVLSSYTQVLIFSKNLESQANIRDTIERKLCQNIALHKFDVEFIKDTLLFKAMFVEINDFKFNK